MPKICEFGIRHSSSGGHKNYGIKITAAAATTTAGVAQDHTENLSRRANLMRCWNFKLRNQVKSARVLWKTCRAVGENHGIFEISNEIITQKTLE